MLTLQTPQPSRAPQPTAKATRLSHVVFGRPDLDRATRFLVDFGLSELERTTTCRYLRGTRSRSYCYRIEQRKRAGFLGLGLAVGTRDELEALADLPEGSEIITSEHPGGGEMVALRDPSGFLVEVVHGQGELARLDHRHALVVNTGDATPRVDATQRPPLEPPSILGLGHLVLEAARYQETCAFYTAHFGFIPSDVQLLPDGSPAVAFLRLDRGETPTDHHTLALAQGVAPVFGHAAFEVVDADAIGVGQRLLRERGWRHAWGIGRHILGSQIFDYWQDPWGDKHEHYTDGDVFTSTVPTGFHPASRDALAQWGPPIPRDFTSPRLSPAKLVAIARHLRDSPDLDLDKLMTLARLFG